MISFSLIFHNLSVKILTCGILEIVESLSSLFVGPKPMAFEHYLACHKCSLFSTIHLLISHLSIATFNPSEISRAMMSTNEDWSSSQ